MRICISSGHSTECQGASGILNEVTEATRVTNQLAIDLRDRGHEVMTYHDTVSTSQNENLNRIVDWHNSQTRDLDLSIHFNAHVETSEPVGCEVLYYSQQALAAKLSAAIAVCGFIDRGAKKRKDLFFLNSTAMPAALLEICFVDSEADAGIYRENFEDICDSLADVAGSDEDEDIFAPPGGEALFRAIGACSEFGGPEDIGAGAALRRHRRQPASVPALPAVRQLRSGAAPQSLRSLHRLQVELRCNPKEHAGGGHRVGAGALDWCGDGRLSGGLGSEREHRKGR
jgi:hypothetical protein